MKNVGPDMITILRFEKIGSVVREMSSEKNQSEVDTSVHSSDSA